MVIKKIFSRTKTQKKEEKIANLEENSSPLDFENPMEASLLKPSPNFMQNDSDYRDYQIGPCTYGKPLVKKWDDSTKLIIGNYCSIAASVMILLGGEHRKDWITTYPFNVIFKEAVQFQGHPATKGDVIIKNDVWVGTNCIILSGVTIGNGAVIGAGSVVSKDIPPYAIAVGNPIRIVRKRFTEEEIEKLEQIAWWNWPHEKIMEALPTLLSDHISEFITKYSQDTNYS